jgi:cytochrome c oxidase subunit 2
MKSPARRRAVLGGIGAIGTTGLTLAGGLAARIARAQAPREIEIVAQRFSYTPNEIPLKLGERVMIALKAVDYEHGFSVPDLKLRADLVPGRVVRVELQPRAVGRIDFLCDNFCGEGHEDMHGQFIVSE